MNKKLYGLIILYLTTLKAPETISDLDNLEKKYPTKRLVEAFVMPPDPPGLTLANFRGWTVINSIFNGTSIGNTDFSNATLKGTNNKNTIFSRDLKNGIFQSAILENVLFDAPVINADFKQATLTNVEFHAEVSGIFDGAILTNVSFGGTYSGSFAGTTITNCTDRGGKALVVQYGKLVTFASKAQKQKGVKTNS